VRWPCAQILPDEARGWALRMPKVRRTSLVTVSDVLHRSDAFAFTGGARDGAGTQVNPPVFTRTVKGTRGAGAAVSRLEPVIRAWVATRDVRGRYLLVEVPPAWWATPGARDQHPRTAAKAVGRAGELDGAPADERKGMRQGRDRPKRVKRTATRTSRDSTPREWTWAEQAPSPNDDGGKP